MRGQIERLTSSGENEEALPNESENCTDYSCAHLGSGLKRPQAKDFAETNSFSKSPPIKGSFDLKIENLFTATHSGIYILEEVGTRVTRSARQPLKKPHDPLWPHAFPGHPDDSVGDPDLCARRKARLCVAPGFSCLLLSLRLSDQSARDGNLEFRSTSRQHHPVSPL